MEPLLLNKLAPKGAHSPLQNRESEWNQNQQLPSAVNVFSTNHISFPYFSTSESLSNCLSEEQSTDKLLSSFFFFLKNSNVCIADFSQLQWHLLPLLGPSYGARFGSSLLILPILPFTPTHPSEEYSTFALELLQVLSLQDFNLGSKSPIFHKIL